MVGNRWARDHNCPMAPADPSLVLAAVGAPVVAGLATLLIPRAQNLARVLLAACGPAASLLLLGVHLTRYGVAPNHAGTTAIDWVPSLHLDLSFLVDGLGAFFALLLSLIHI